MPRDVVARIHVATHYLTERITTMLSAIDQANQLKSGLETMIANMDHEIVKNVASLEAHAGQFGADEASKAIIQKFQDDMNACRNEAKILEPQVEDATANLFAYNIALESLCTALLQTARQLMVSVGGGKNSCAAGRMIGTQALKEVAWQARNQSIHYDDGNALHGATQACFTQLNVDFAGQFDLPTNTNKNFAPEIVRLLEWDNIARFDTDIRQIVNLPAVPQV